MQNARELSKERLTRDWKDRPVVSFASQIAGGVPLGATKGAAAAYNWARGGSSLGAAAKTGLLGLGLGTAQGFNSGFGGQDSINNAAIGGIGGGILGVATGPIIRSLTSPVGKSAADVLTEVAKKAAKSNNSTKAEQYLAKQLAKRPDLKNMVARAEAADIASKNTGIPLTLAEKIAQTPTDQLLMQQKNLASNPATAGQMEAFYAARSGTPKTQGQIEQALLNKVKELSPGTQNYDDIAQQLIARGDQAAKNVTGKLTAKASPLYEAAMAKSIPVETKTVYQMADGVPILGTGKTQIMDNELSDLMKSNPVAADFIKKALNTSDPSLLAQVSGKNSNSIAVLDAAKKLIDKAAKGYGADAPANPRALQEAKTAIVDLATKYSPEYGQALSAYSGSPDLLQLRQQVGQLADVDPMRADKVADVLFRGTPANAQRTAEALGPEGARQAAAARVLDVMGQARGQPTTYADKIAPNADTTEMLRAYAGNALDDTLDTIRQAALGEKVRMGSQTTPLRESSNALQEAASGLTDIATGNKIGLLNKVASIFGKTPEDDPRFYSDMLDLMQTEKGMDLMRRVAGQQSTALQKQELYQALEPTISGVRFGTRGAAYGQLLSPEPENAPMQSSAPTQPAIPPAKHNIDDFSDMEEYLNRQNNKTPGKDDFSDIEEYLGRQSNNANGSYLDKVAMIESGGNPNARASTSSASGLYQFTNPTWKSMVAKYGADTGIGLRDKNNPDAQRVMAQLLSNENGAALKSAGFSPSNENLYLAHFLGAGGAKKVLSNPNAYASQLLPQAAAANRAIFYSRGRPRTSAELQNVLAQKLMGV